MKDGTYIISAIWRMDMQNFEIGKNDVDLIHSDEPTVTIALYEYRGLIRNECRIQELEKMNAELQLKSKDLEERIQQRDREKLREGLMQQSAASSYPESFDRKAETETPDMME